MVVAASAGLVGQARENVHLRDTAAQQASVSARQAAELRTELASLNQRAAAAEADALAMQKALQTAQASQVATASARVITDPAQQAALALQHARTLRINGKFQESLDEYLKVYRALAGKRYGPPADQQNVMTAILRLSDQFPPAMTSLRELRDIAFQKVRANPENRELVTEAALLNERLGDGNASMALYDTLAPNHPGRQAIGLIAFNSFVEAHRYADALLGKSFRSMLSDFERGERLSRDGRTLQRQNVIKGILLNIEVLTGAGKAAEAQTLTDKLLAYDGSESTRAAIKQHVERASRATRP